MRCTFFSQRFLSQMSFFSPLHSGNEKLREMSHVNDVSEMKKVSTTKRPRKNYEFSYICGGYQWADLVSEKSKWTRSQIVVGGGEGFPFASLNPKKKPSKCIGRGRLFSAASNSNKKAKEEKRERSHEVFLQCLPWRPGQVMGP